MSMVDFEEFVRISIKKYKNDMNRRKDAAIEAIMNDSFAEAREALNDASQCAAIIAEYEFVIEMLEVEHV